MRKIIFRILNYIVKIKSQRKITIKNNKIDKKKADEVTKDIYPLF